MTFKPHAWGKQEDEYFDECDYTFKPHAWGKLLI